MRRSEEENKEEKDRDVKNKRREIEERLTRKIQLDNYIDQNTPRQLEKVIA